MLRYPLNVSREFVNDTVHRNDLEFYMDKWPGSTECSIACPIACPIESSMECVSTECAI